MHILPSGRLPRSVVPKRYDLTLAIEPKQGKFSGAVSIDLEIHEATPTIILHAVDLLLPPRHGVMIPAGHPSAPDDKGQDRKTQWPPKEETEDHQRDPGGTPQLVGRFGNSR